MSEKPISNEYDPRILRVRQALRDANTTTVLIDDEENIIQALIGGFQLDAIFVGDNAQLPDKLTAAAVPKYQVKTAVNKKLFGDERKSRVYAVGSNFAAPTINDVINASGDIVVLDGVKLAGNIGAITRNALAFHAAGVILVNSDVTTIYDRRLIRASRGALFRIPIAFATANELLTHLEQHNIPMVALDGQAEAELRSLADFSGRIAILMGSEKFGASAELKAQAALQCKIAINPEIESLNVSVAAALALYARGL